MASFKDYVEVLGATMALATFCKAVFEFTRQNTEKRTK